jgi:hypothetical protein
MEWVKAGFSKGMAWPKQAEKFRIEKIFKDY